MRFFHVNMRFFPNMHVEKKSHVNMEHLFLMTRLASYRRVASSSSSSSQSSWSLPPAMVASSPAGVRSCSLFCSVLITRVPSASTSKAADFPPIAMTAPPAAKRACPPALSAAVSTLQVPGLGQPYACDSFIANFARARNNPKRCDSTPII